MTKSQKIQQYIQTVIISSNIDSLIDHLVGMIKQIHPGDETIDAAFGKDVVEKVKQTIDSGLVEFYKPMAEFMDKNYSEAEIDELLAFFNSETGAKYMALQIEQIKALHPVNMQLAEKVQNVVEEILEKKDRGF